MCFHNDNLLHNLPALDGQICEFCGNNTECCSCELDDGPVEYCLCHGVPSWECPDND